jgi:general secretion pathway protein L
MQAQAPLPRESLIEQALPGADPVALQALARRTVVLPAQTLVNANTSDLRVLQAVTPAVEPARLQALLGERDAGHWLLNRGDIANRLQLSNRTDGGTSLGIHSEWFLAVGRVQADGSAVDFRALLWREYRDDGVRAATRVDEDRRMNVQLRVRLPTLEGLHADSAVDWAQLHKGEVLAHGCATLAALGLRHPRAAVHACLDPNDLILLELQLPPLSGRRLQLALQGEVEAMLLDDLQDVALAHGAQAADGTVPVAWLGQQAVLQAQQLLASCGLRLGTHPTPLLLPWQDGQATLQVSGEHLLVRSGRDRGFVQWYGGRDACAVMQALAVRLRQAGVQAVQWIGSVPPAWPDSLPATAVMKERQACGPLPGWSLPLPGAGRQAPRLAIGLALAAVLLAALGLQLQVWRRIEGRGPATGHGAAVQRTLPGDHRCGGSGAAGKACSGGAATGAAVAAAATAGSQHAAGGSGLAGQVRSLHYQPGQLDMELDADAQALADDPQRLSTGSRRCRRRACCWRATPVGACG